MKKVWLIGASEGIGRALALELARQRYQLFVSARSQDRLVSLVEECEGQHYAVSLDVQSNVSIEQAWQQIQDIDILIYCAGDYKPMSAKQIEIEPIERMIDINLTGCFRVLNVVLPTFIQRDQGKVVLIGSIAAYRGLPNAMGYGASKAGILHLAENLACDLHDTKIDVQIINPGFVKTRLTDLNKFDMPSLMTTEAAAKAIAKRIQKNKFESRFPSLFANALKIMSRLPYWLYFRLLSRL